MRPFLIIALLLVVPSFAHAVEDAPAVERRSSLSGLLVAPVDLHRSPGGPRIGRLGTRTEWSGHPVRLLVLERATVSGERWYRVLLASRPNGSSAWIPADYLLARRNPWRVVVDRRRREMTVYRSGRVVRRRSVVVGKPSTPTPRGLSAVWEEVRQSPADGFLGPYVLHLTIHSRVLKNYGGGPGRTALHGRSGASLRDPLGSARSHGCVRMTNADISWLAGRIGPGTPVELR